MTTRKIATIRITALALWTISLVSTAAIPLGGESIELSKKVGALDANPLLALVAILALVAAVYMHRLLVTALREETKARVDLFREQSDKFEQLIREVTRANAQER